MDPLDSNINGKLISLFFSRFKYLSGTIGEGNDLYPFFYLDLLNHQFFTCLGPFFLSKRTNFRQFSSPLAFAFFSFALFTNYARMLRFYKELSLS
mmetsp:Transcript_62981/g.72255  ORF Transcript_62981/g.72255 Transcript_62981/m.72255 type:complete len:95 (-) Transcript_62981:106-390(-)